jgi:hypothetical protein
VNLVSVLIGRWISARVLGLTRRKAISQMALWPSSPQAPAARGSASHGRGGCEQNNDKPRHLILKLRSRLYCGVSFAGPALVFHPPRSRAGFPFAVLLTN